MSRKIVQTGSSLAVTLPKDIVDQLGLKKGDEVEVSAHPLNGTIVVRPPIKYFEDGKVTKRFNELAKGVLRRYDKAFRKLAE
ncbi:MAG: AbrB/MazE/SpoVT family DNA-binding domain-containing protein [Bryobacteraceae bacterium]